MADDPLYGDRAKPPLVPMNNDEIIEFDLIRELDGASRRKRLFVVGSFVIGIALIALLTVLYTRSSSTPNSKVVRVDTAQHALTYLCSQFRSAEASYTKDRGSESAFKRRVDTLTSTAVAFSSASLSRFERDLTAVDAQLTTYDSIDGPSLVDLHELCVY